MMIDPPRRASIIAGMTAFVVCQTPVRLTSMTSRHCCSDSRQDVPPLTIPAFAQNDVNAAECRQGRRCSGVHRCRVTYVGLDRDRLAAALAHEFDRLAQIGRGSSGIGDARQ